MMFQVNLIMIIIKGLFWNKLIRKPIKKLYNQSATNKDFSLLCVYKNQIMIIISFLKLKIINKKIYEIKSLDYR